MEEKVPTPGWLNYERYGTFANIDAGAPAEKAYAWTIAQVKSCLLYTSVQSAIKIVANENRYHPVRDYLNSLQWDGTERIRYALTKFLGAEESEYVYECLRLFMLAYLILQFY